MRILITGTSGGIGAAVASAALARDFEVVALNRADFEGASPERTFLDRAQVPFDALVFCTGTCPVRPVALTSDALLDETFRVNCGLFHALMREIVAERLYAREGFAALAVSSVSATEGWPGGAAYCASKGALSSLCRAMAAELAPKRIAVAALEPRYVKTRMFDACAGRMGVPASAAEAPEAVAERILRIVGENLERMKGSKAR